MKKFARTGVAFWAVCILLVANAHATEASQTGTVAQSAALRAGMAALEEKDYAAALAHFKPLAKADNAEAEAQLARMYAHGQGVTRDPEKAAQLYRASADQGNADGENGVGVSYEEGTLSAQPDYALARKFYLKSAAQGNAKGEYNLGRFYEYGFGDQRNCQKAIELLRSSALQGYALAEYALGKKYDKASGDETCPRDDDAMAAKWYRRAAVQPSTEAGILAANNLGLMYEFGRGVPKNIKRAMALYRESAEGGNTVAEENLGRSYEFGSGVKRNYAEALKWNRLAEKSDDDEAEYDLAMMYEHGWGVKKSVTEATKYYLAAATQGNADAEVHLGIFYLFGKDSRNGYKKALAWCTRAAGQGNSDGYNCLGMIYVNGYGVPRDVPRANDLFAFAASHGNSSAMLNLAESFMDGAGVHRDPVVAWALSQLALSKRDDEENTARTYLETITASLSSDQLGDATRLYKYMLKSNVISALDAYRALRAKEAAIRASDQATK